MANANERKALWFLAIVAVSGSGVRLWRASVPRVEPAETSALERQIGRVDSVRALPHTPKVRRAPAPSAPAESRADSTPRAQVDLDRATAEEIEALPGIGPSLAKRIAAARDSAGPFGELEALCAVSGIGPALVKKLRPLVTFSGARRPLSDACGEASKRPSKSRASRTRQPR